MLTLRHIEENQQYIIDRLAIKKFDAKKIISDLLGKDKQRRTSQQILESKQAEINTISKEIGKLVGAGKTGEANKIKEKTSQLKEEIKVLHQELAVAEKVIYEMLLQIPNVPHPLVPSGAGEEDNQVVRSGGSIPVLPENAQPHWDLAAKYDIIDFELGNKLTGAGFPVYKGKGAKLQRALINYFLDEAEKAGYTEVLPPILVNEDSGFGTGQLPDKEGQMYHVPSENFFLIPTAEVPVTNIYRDVILTPEDFPVKNCAYTPCFRREAGSYGKDVRGLNRLHQFDKVEIVQIQHPDLSYDALEEMVQHVEGLVQNLGLPYRIQILCGGDISFTAALTYDFEVFAAAQKKWLEVSSVSNFESFQSSRMRLRFREKSEKKTRLAHTLNGSALALPRVVAAILENNQSEKGIAVPDVLVPYTQFDLIR